MKQWALIAGFGALGVIGRYTITQMAAVPALATFLINLMGSFAIGLIYVLGMEHSMIPAEWRIGLTVGLLGGFTTFSAYSLETINFIERGEISLALAFAVASPILGIVACWLGVLCGRFAISH